MKEPRNDTKKHETDVPKIPKKKIEDARDIYIELGGRNFGLLQKKMREMGWGRFSYRTLYNYRSRGRYCKGWIERYGFREFLLQASGSYLKKRQQCQADFPVWLKETRPEWMWDWPYQSFIYKRLFDVTRGRIDRLMIFLPPRHGKSELVTVRYAAWRLMKDPKLNIIVGSYNQKLANRFSRKIRREFENCSSGGNKNLTPKGVTLNRTLNRADEWETREGGGVKAVGVGAGVTGFGADLIIIDDPIKSRAEAESKNNRDRIAEWFNDDIHTRLEPGGAIILIQTRWHEDDLAGRLLKEAEDGGEQWTVVKLPALAEADDPLEREEGEALCRQRYDRKALLAKKRKLGSYSFSALYQQSPTPAEGGLFQRSWFTRIVDRAPEGLRWCRGYDLAVSTKTSADYTASMRCTLDREGNLYIADGFRKRVEYPEQRRYILQRIREEKDTEHGIEQALHGQAFIQELRREERLSSRAFRGIKVSTDKFTRALAWANRAEEGKVILVRGAWIDEFLDEVCRFPNGPHDDQVDAVSIAVQMLESRRRMAYGF